MGIRKNRLMWIIAGFVGIGVLLVGVAASGGSFGIASTGGGTPQHFVTAEPVREAPQSVNVAQYRTSTLTENEAIREVVNKAVSNNRTANKNLNESSNRDVERILKNSPAYTNNDGNRGVYIEKDGVIVRVEDQTAIPA